MTSLILDDIRAYEAGERAQEHFENESNEIILVDYIVEYEAGCLDEFDTCILFQHLVNTGLAWSLPGSYGRTAQELLNAGLIQPAFLGEGED